MSSMTDQRAKLALLVFCFAAIGCQSATTVSTYTSTIGLTAVNSFSASSQSCVFINCPKGFHCEGGACFLDDFDPCKFVKCPFSKRCQAGVCVEQPNSCASIRCALGQHCEKGGRCISNYDPCRYVQCDSSEVCVNGDCQALISQYCRFNWECRFPKLCISGVCRKW